MAPSTFSTHHHEREGTPTMTRQKDQMAEALDTIWNAADDAVAAHDAGLRSEADLVATLRRIAEEAACGLADLPWRLRPL
jgi:hypothetical protein